MDENLLRAKLVTEIARDSTNFPYNSHIRLSLKVLFKSKLYITCLKFDKVEYKILSDFKSDRKI